MTQAQEVGRGYEQFVPPQAPPGMYFDPAGAPPGGGAR
jgi:hypothetical protein